MKLRSKEINIFNMSALDLFASALGAFILISVVLFPYFPNTGDSPERVAEVRAQLEQVQSKLQAAEKDLTEKETELKKATDELARVRFPHLDIVIALDISGSMRNEITGLKNEVEQLADVLLKLAPSLSMGIIAFSDRHYETPIFKFDLRQIRIVSDLETLKRFTSTLSPSMGQGSGRNDDKPEAINLALKEAVNMSWRSRAEKEIIVIVTDNPVYPEEEVNTLSLAKEFSSRGANNNVSTVYANTGSSASNTQSFLEQLARAGQGQYVKGGSSITANILMSLL